MAEPGRSRGLEGCSDRPALRRTLRDRLRTVMPGLRIVAEDFLAQLSAIDLLAIGGGGELVSIRLAEPGEDAAALTRSLSDLVWLRPRRADLAQLAPALGIEPSAEPRALLVAREFGPETRAAAEYLSEQTLQLLRWEGVSPSPSPIRTTPSLPPPPGESSAAARRSPRPERAHRPGDPSRSRAFRTGLVEADLEPPRGAGSVNVHRSAAEAVLPTKR